MSWTGADTPDVSGKHFVITGGNSGIGLEAAVILARRGGHVTLACRNPKKAAAAQQRVQSSAPGARVDLLQLDLADLSSVRTAAAELHTRGHRVAALVNNAGVMAIPRRETADGFEMQLGTNHLGHFAWTLQVLDLVDERVVTVASVAHRMGRLRRDDLMFTRGYNKWLAYGQSKLANLLFTLGLEKRLRAAESAVKAVACHPGYASTNLQHVGPQMTGSGLMGGVMKLGNGLIAQSAEAGAWPTVFAATMPVDGGTYWGPDGLGEMRGRVGPAAVSRRARDAADQDALWAQSEALTGVSWAGVALGR